MRKMMVAILACGLSVALMSVASEPAPVGKTPPGYKIFQAVPLTLEINGISGQLQILQDERITEGFRDAWGMTNDPYRALQDADPAADEDADEDDLLLKSIKTKPLRNGRLRLVRSDGKVLAEDKFDVPLGKIEAAFLYPSKFPSFMIWTDHGIGWGSYAGPAMSVLEVRGGQSAYVQAVTEDGKSRLRISYAESLKHAGRIVGQEIQRMDCQPNFDHEKIEGEEGDFVVSFSTYRFDGAQWVFRLRRRIGCIENTGDDNSWPEDRSIFP